VIWAVVLAAGESRRMGTQKLLLPYGGTTVAGAVARAARDSRADRVLVVLGADRDAVRGGIEAALGGGSEAVRGEIEASLGEGRGSSDAGTETRAGDGLGPGTAKETAGNAMGPDERIGRGGPEEPAEPAQGRGKKSGPPASGAPPRVVTFTVNESYRQGMLSSIKAGFRALPPEAGAAVIMLGDQPFIASSVIDGVIAAYGKEGGAGKGIVLPTFGGRRGHPVLVDLKYRDEVLALDPSDGLRQLMWAHPDDILEVEAGDAAILRDLDTPADYQDGGDHDRVRSTFFEKK